MMENPRVFGDGGKYQQCASWVEGLLVQEVVSWKGQETGIFKSFVELVIPEYILYDK
jgi:hypothetical protein